VQCHVADLFEHYGVHRPAMLRAWAAGSDVDGHGNSLPADCVWQANLWRRLRDKLGGPSPAERLGEACARIRDCPSLVELPPRLSLFGLTRIPASYVEVFRALACGRDVHLFALHPSPVLWAAVARRGVPAGPVPRHLDTSADAPRHPLLSSWARDAREMQSGADRVR
jgi:exodeoxyribonuclease V gamma subunit